MIFKELNLLRNKNKTDIEFSLWDAVSGETQVGSTNTLNGVLVVDGRFTVELDFGTAAFDNSEHWLEIEINGKIKPFDPMEDLTKPIDDDALDALIKYVDSQLKNQVFPGYPKTSPRNVFRLFE